jgi:hypothetical protein
MKNPLTRRALLWTALYLLAGPVIATVAALLQQSGGWFVFTWFDFLAAWFVYYVLPLVLLLWAGWAAFRFNGNERSTYLFSLYGLLLPLAYYLAWQVPAFVERQWHAYQLTQARFEDVTDTPLLSAKGQPIGIRFTYRVTFPLGLSALGQEPPADAPMAGLYLPRDKSTLMFFANRTSTLLDVARSGFPAGTTKVTIDAVPAFMPLAIQASGSFPASTPANLCFRWKDAEDRTLQLSAGKQHVLLEVGPYGRYVQRGARATNREYSLAAFYQGALAEGAVECGPDNN